MPRTDLFIKVQLDLKPGEDAQKLAGEICRRIEKIYSVRSVEISNIFAHPDD
jgi:hypothetical protein